MTTIGYPLRRAFLHNMAFDEPPETWDTTLTLWLPDLDRNTTRAALLQARQAYREGRGLDARTLIDQLATQPLQETSRCGSNSTTTSPTTPKSTDSQTEPSAST